MIHTCSSATIRTAGPIVGVARVLVAEYVHGTFNVEKCVRYLRSVGVEISAEMEASWMDAQKADRFLRSMKGVAAEGYVVRCRNGHTHYMERRRGQRRKGDPDAKCECGALLVGFSARWVRLRDGTVKDYRHPSERWKPLDSPVE